MSRGTDRAPRVAGRYAALALVTLGLVLGPACTGQGPRTAKHVIVISMDTTRADHFGFMGSTTVRTPRLDALARESIVFTDCLTAAPTTLASHTALFTGKYPHHHGTPRNGFMVNRENDMLAEILQRQGFHTAGFAGSFALDSRFDFAQGFDHYDEEFEILVGEQGADQNQRTAAEVNDTILSYLDRVGTPERLFLFAHYFDPHQPYSAPAPFDSAYDPEGGHGLPSMRELKTSDAISAADKRAYALRFAHQYAAEISYTDHHIGRLLDALAERGILDDAIVVITSDHGENLWYHPQQFDHGYHVYQSTVHSLCMYRLPGGQSGGTRIDNVVSNVDVMPTLLQWLRIDAPGGIDGEAVDLTALDQPIAPRMRFAQATKPWREVEVEGEWNNLHKTRCVREGSFKFIQNPLSETEALYDIVSDPGERNDLLLDASAETQALANRLRAQLEAWAASADPLPSTFQRSQREETIRRLRSLGYIN